MKYRAFALIEVVVALALGATLVVALQALAVATRRSAAALDTELRGRAAAEWPRELLRTDLEQLASLDGLTLQDGVLTLSGLNSCYTERDAPRHRVEIRYRVVNGRAVREEREPEDEATWQTLTLAWRRLEPAIFDGQTWQPRWPPSLYRPPRAVQVVADETIVAPIGPLAWEVPR